MSHLRPSLLPLIAQSWTLPFFPTLSVLVTAVVYFRGWRVARITRPRELPAWRAACFLGGLLTMWLALASPIDALDSFLIVAHMTQHLLLLSLAPPLLLMGRPVVPLLRGLPRVFVRGELAPWMNSRAFRFLQRLLTHPAFGWFGMVVVVVFWHMPPAYELTLHSEFWHEFEHGCFFFTALAFWWYVIRPWPTHLRATRWFILPYVMSAHLVVATVAFVITLSGSVIYPSYASVPRLFGMSALTDQGLAGSEMAFASLIVALATLCPLVIQLVSEEQDRVPGIQSAVWRRLQFVRATKQNRRTRAAFLEPLRHWRFARPAAYIVVIVLLSSLAVYSLHTSDSDDDARLLFRHDAGPYVLSLFAAPDPLTQGEVDFNVAVERPGNEGLVPDANVEIVLTPADGGRPISVRARYASAARRFLQTATVNLPRSGDWRVTVLARRGDDIASHSAEINVLPAGSGHELMWDMAAVALVLLLFFLHQWRKRVYNRARRSHVKAAHHATPAAAA